MIDSGVCLFAYSNQQLDYIKLAVLSAMSAKKQLNNIPVCLITDTAGEKYMLKNIPKHVSCVFDHVIIAPAADSQNIRLHFDSPWQKFYADFKNRNKHLVYELTPFNKTLLMDCDFLLYNNQYLNLFKSNTKLSMYKSAVDLVMSPPAAAEQRLNPKGIDMFWSTVVYFEKSKLSEIFFNLWAHISENYEFYTTRYQFPDGLFRTDFCVSIASHIMADFSNNTFIQDMPDSPMTFMSQRDEIVNVSTDHSGLVLLSNNRKEQWRDIAVKHVNTNLHLMNKKSMLRHYDALLVSFQNEP